MIPQTLTEKLRGYLPKDHEGAVAPFFPCVNIAFRRQVFDDVGGFDLSMRNSEDVDFCVRVVDSRWELFYNPDASVEHFNRSTLRALMKQFWNYGFYKAPLFAKHSRSAIEVLVPSRWHGIKSYNVVYWRHRAPVRAAVFVSSFAVLHGALATAAVAAAAGATPVTAVALLVAGGAAVAYFRRDLVRDAPLGERLRSGAVRYLVNLSRLAGGLLGGLQNGLLYVDAIAEPRL